MLKNILLFALLSFTTPLVFAFSVQPMVFELDASGGNSRTTLTIANDGSTPLSIELIPQRITIDDAGKETRTPADDDLLLFPPVALVNPGTSQVVQVQYVGDPEIAQSIPYRVSVNQVAVNVGSDASEGIRVAANFNTLLNVVPLASNAALGVESIEKNQSDPAKWTLMIKNTGNKYARLSRTEWVVRDGQQVVELSSSEVAKRSESDLMLPNRTRIVVFTPPDGMNAKTSTVEILLK